MTPKQERFVQEYLIDLNATQAAIRAGYTLRANGRGFYVYFLTDNRTGQIFYVGKGKGNRLSAHRPGTKVNQIKLDRIHECGEHLGKLVFVDELSEPVAFQIERTLIKQFRDYGLTNIAGGCVSVAEAELAKVNASIRRILPYDVWLQTAGPEKLETVTRVFGSPREFYGWFTDAWQDLKRRSELQMVAPHG